MSTPSTAGLRTSEKVELTLIPLAALAVWLGREVFPQTLSAGNLCLFLAGLLLVQSLVRDLWIWTRLRLVSPTQRAAPVRRQCMCVESLVGLGGVLAGLLLMGAFGGAFLTLSIAPRLWPVLVIVVTTGGFFLKDLVIDWSQRKILRERDHSNILPRWK